MCATGYADCDKSAANGCEIDTNTNVANCGGCGMPCNMTGGVEGRVESRKLGESSLKDHEGQEG
jgi:hypothetical protein